MSFKIFFRILFFVTVSIVLFACKHIGDQDKPNIVFILIDDLGWTDVGFMGSEFYETPNIDELANEGMVFTNAYAACAVCSPTRASIITGRYPVRSGITDWIRPYYLRGEKLKRPVNYVGDSSRKLLCPPNPYWMELKEVTLAEMLKETGYTTLHVGKWHLGGEKFHPEKQGFDLNIGGCDYGQPPSYFDPYTNKRLPEGIPTLPAKIEREYLTDREADEVVNFINDHNNLPFYVNLCHYAVHTPIQAKEENIEYFKDKEKENDQDNPVYASMIKSVDDAVGKIVSALKKNNLLDNTIIIFFSDNGGHNAYTSNLPLRSGKGNPWEGGIRVPMIVFWPKEVSPGQICTTPVSSVDFFPTLCDAADLSIPDSLLLDGVDLSPLFKGNDLPENRDIFWHFPHYRDYESVTPYSIIRSGKWKMIRFWEGQTELYDLENDISERLNLADSLPDQVAAMNQKLDNWLTESGALLPVSNPNFKDTGEALGN